MTIPAKLCWFWDAHGKRYHVGAAVGEAYVYMYVPRDQRHGPWHKAHWWSVPEWARLKLDDGVYRVDAIYARECTSVLRAYYPEAVIEWGA